MRSEGHTELHPCVTVDGGQGCCLSRARPPLSTTQCHSEDFIVFAEFAFGTPSLRFVYATINKHCVCVSVRVCEREHESKCTHMKE